MRCGRAEARALEMYLVPRGVIDLAITSGNLVAKDPVHEWEFKSVLGLLGQPPGEVHCLRCRYSTLTRRYFQCGFCTHGVSCAYRHHGVVQDDGYYLARRSQGSGNLVNVWSRMDPWRESD